MNPIPLIPALLLAAGMPPEPLTCTVAPRIVQVGAFYSGANIRVEGRATAGSKLVLTVTGSDREERFSRKARFGPIWLNASKVRISGAPSLFLRFSTGPVAAILSPGAIVQNGLDEKSLVARMRIEPQSPDRRDDDAVRSDFVALMKSRGTYVFGGGGIAMRDLGDSASFSLDLHWPKRAPPATYQVMVYEVVQGAVVGKASASLSVVATGFPAWLAAMAANRASVYGVVAVLIGGLAGFGIDRLATLLFGKARSVDH
ncbi:MAG: TIGR02186 family protein [Bryobacteraceae bacterium]